MNFFPFKKKVKFEDIEINVPANNNEFLTKVIRKLYEDTEEKVNK